MFKYTFILILAGLLAVEAEASSCKQLAQSGSSEKALEVCTSEAKNGDAEAQYILGSMYCSDKEDKDCEIGMQWLQKSARQGYADAMLTQASIWMLDPTVSVQKKGLSLLHKAGDAGSAEAALRLGAAYFHGGDVKQDVVQSMHWYELAAERGHPFAQFHIGLAYLSGEGVKQNDQKGVFWLKKAVEQELPDALFVLGMSYVNGESSLVKDRSRGMVMLRKAAKMGNVRASMYIGQNDF